jgi:hypothetical protein
MYTLFWRQSAGSIPAARTNTFSWSECKRQLPRFSFVAMS